MTKNIIVVDAQGRKYGTTYPKRAKRLVKQGRARYLTQNMLCLACPPNQNLEDNDMSELTIENNENIETTNIEAVGIEREGSAAQSKYSMEYCLEQIERIAHQTESLDQAITELHQLDNDSSCEQKAAALGEIITCREKTNQQMLRFYEKMYDDLKPVTQIDAVSHKAHLQEQMLKIIEKTLENGDYPVDDVMDMFNGAFDAIRHLND